MAKTNVYGIESRLLRAAFHLHDMFVETAVLNNIIDTLRSIPGTDISFSSLEKNVNAQGNPHSISMLELHPFSDKSDQPADKYIIHTKEHGSERTDDLSAPTYTIVKVSSEIYNRNICRILASDSGENEDFAAAAIKLQPDKSKYTTANMLNVTEIIAGILKDFYPEISNEIDTKASFMTTGRTPKKAKSAPQRSPELP